MKKIDHNGSPTSLYFLVSSDFTKFKIGISTDVINRINQLSIKNSFNLDESYHLQWPSSREASNAEKSLHFFFDRFRICDMPLSDGYTEWFDYIIFEDALRFLKQLMVNHDLSLDSLHKGISIPKKESITGTPKKLLYKTKEIKKGPIYLTENNIAIMQLYNKIKNWEPFLLGAEIQKVRIWEYFNLVYYFGELEKHNNDFLILPEGKSMPITMDGANCVFYETPTTRGGINLILGLEIDQSTSLVYVYPLPYSSLIESAQQECLEGLSIFTDLFSSYSPLFKNY